MTRPWAGKMWWILFSHWLPEVALSSRSEFPVLYKHFSDWPILACASSLVTCVSLSRRKWEEGIRWRRKWRKPFPAMQRRNSRMIARIRKHTTLQMSRQKCVHSPPPPPLIIIVIIIIIIIRSLMSLGEGGGQRRWTLQSTRLWGAEVKKC